MKTISELIWNAENPDNSTSGSIEAVSKSV